MNKLYQEALSLIQSYDTIILHRHSLPDGDAVGSQVGLRNLIRENFPKKSCYLAGDSASRFSFIPDSAPQEMPDDIFPQALSIILDCGASSLISDERYRHAGATLRFDHHIFQEKVADLDICDASFESASGLVADFAMEMGLDISPISALPLYMGIVTDSGRFRFDAVTPRTFRIAAELLSRGLDTNNLYSHLYSSSIGEIQRRAQFAMKIQYTPEGVAYLYNTREEIERLGMSTFEASRGMVNIMSDLEGVDIWANFTESPEGIIAELRSSIYTVQPIAVKYGGGGHARACGATLSSRREVKNMLNDLDEILRSVRHE